MKVSYLNQFRVFRIPMRMNIMYIFPYPCEYVYFTCSYIGRIFLDVNILQEDEQKQSKLLHYWDLPESWEETCRLEETCCHSSFRKDHLETLGEKFASSKINSDKNLTKNVILHENEIPWGFKIQTD